MKVIIKEDNLIHKQLINDILIKLQFKLNLQFDIITTDNINEIVNYNQLYSDIINIIDIIDEENISFTGINLAELIRSVSNTAHIIFLTSYDFYIKQAVNSNIEPLAYISKTDPNIDNLLMNAFKKVMHKKSHFGQDMRIEFTDANSDTIYVNIKDIYMIHTSPSRQKHLLIETSLDTHHVRGKISDLIGHNVNLVQTHKSTIVNKTKIHKITKGTNPKNRRILFKPIKGKDFPECFLSEKYKSNLT